MSKSKNKQERQELKIDQDGIHHLFKPVNVNPILVNDNDNIGVQLGGKLSKSKLKIVNVMMFSKILKSSHFLFKKS